MTGRVLSVNVGRPRVIGMRGGEPVTSGIAKAPVAGPVAAGPNGLAGDGQADLVNHGGADKAIYVLDRSDAGLWEDRLGRPLGPGAFGENLSIEGFPSTSVHVGDRFRIGAAEFEVTQPRVPCYKLGIHMGDERFPAAFAKALRVGFYLRVIAPGAVTAGDAVVRTHTATTPLTIADLMGIYLTARDDAARLEAVAALPALSEAWRTQFADLAAAARGR
ncbi:MAG: MOSC domain-containing protein [Gemmatimonas sp.]